MRKNLVLAAPLVWAVIVFILHIVHIQSDSERSILPHADKVIHFSMFFTLSYLVFRIWISGSNSSVKFLVIALLCAYGALLEWMQGLEFVRRDPDLLDWLADTTGVLFGMRISSIRKTKTHLPS